MERAVSSSCPLPFTSSSSPFCCGACPWSIGGRGHDATGAVVPNLTHLSATSAPCARCTRVCHARVRPFERNPNKELPRLPTEAPGVPSSSGHASGRTRHMITFRRRLLTPSDASVWAPARPQAPSPFRAPARSSGLLQKGTHACPHTTRPRSSRLMSSALSAAASGRPARSCAEGDGGSAHTDLPRGAPFQREGGSSPPPQSGAESLEAPKKIVDWPKARKTIWPNLFRERGGGCLSSPAPPPSGGAEVRKGPPGAALAIPRPGARGKRAVRQDFGE